MAVVTVNLMTVSGTDYARAFVFQTKDGNDVVTPVDLTDSELRLSVRRNPTDVEAMVAIGSSDEGGIDITDAINGKFTLAIARIILNRMTAGIYSHNLVRKRPDGLIEQIWSGTLTHSVGPTHDRIGLT